MSELLTVKKLSGRISVPAYTIRKWIREEKIPAYKMGKCYLCDPEEVIEVIKKLTLVSDTDTSNNMRQNTHRAPQ